MFGLKSEIETNFFKSIWNTAVYTTKRVRNSREIKRKGRKRIAYMRTMTVTITETGYRACVVVGCGMTCDKGCGMTAVRGTE